MLVQGWYRSGRAMGGRRTSSARKIDGLGTVRIGRARRKSAAAQAAAICTTGHAVRRRQRQKERRWPCTDGRAPYMVVRRCSGIGAGRACECGPHAGHAPAQSRAGSAEKLRESRVRPTMLIFSPRVVRCNLGNQCLQDSRRIKRRVKRRVTRSMKRCGKEAGGVCLASLVN